MTKTKYFTLILGLLGWSIVVGGFAQNAEVPDAPGLPAVKPSSSTAVSPQYVLRQGDVVQVKVYQEEDLTIICRIGREGTISMPLLGSVMVASNSLEVATAKIRDLLAQDYLVNPQVTINITEFAKRRFTVLGQVMHPGSFEMPPDEQVSLLQAIATAGGYTRIGNPRKISVLRTVNKQHKVMPMDAEAMASDKTQKPFEVQPDDVIVVGEKFL